MDERELAELRQRLEAINRAGMTPEEAIAALPELGEIGMRVAEIDRLLQRGQEACWVCGATRQRGEMEASIVDGELWWLCARCQTRRINAARIGVVWPAEFDAWWKRWSALRRSEGLSVEALGIVLADAKRLHDADPTVPNLHAAVMRVAEAG